MSSIPSDRAPGDALMSAEGLEKLRSAFFDDWAKLAAAARQGALAAPSDRRFSGSAWESSPQDTLLAHLYLLISQTVQRFVDAADLDANVRARLQFAAMQWVNALSPANFLATNPAAQRVILDSGGEALGRGLAQLVRDVQQGRLTQTDETAFEVGRNLAVTSGAVVYENALFQLIQYAPRTRTVHQRPLLIVPPNINKFYILDLQPDNSFVRHAVDAGFTVFMMSWRNPLPSDDDGSDRATWSDYLNQGVLTAVRHVQQIAGGGQINALGFCVGGTLLASALALAHARGERPVAALTLLTTLLDFSDTGVLDVFVDPAHAAARDVALGAGGLMTGRELAATFAFLRPNELVWNYVVANYFKGETPPAFDLLYWNADSTNLPGPFFSWYFRHTYLENHLITPGHVHVGDAPIDLGQLDMPAYIFGSREDHIVPWGAAYASTQHLPGAARFVLGASGHIAGVINPPAKRKRSYWTHPEDGHFPVASEDWMAGATERPGSWWQDWHGWLARYAGPHVAASAILGDPDHPQLEPAPGRYVAVRI